MQSKACNASFPVFLWRVISLHMVTYMIMGLIFSLLFNYKDVYETSALSVLMRPVSTKWVAAGPALQIFRGILFAAVLWPFRSIFLQKRGWLPLWGLFLGLAVLGTAGPSPSSIEGVIYTTLPVYYHLFGLPETLLQTLAFSLGLNYWYKNPGKLWTVLLISGLVLTLLMSLAGIFLR